MNTKSNFKLELGKSYILFGSDLENSKEVVFNKANELGISKFDITTVSPENDGENKKAEISISNIRDAISEISLTPGFGKGRLLVIESADQLGITAANALLKTLEEPAQNTLICLLSSGLDVIPTIISRCQIIKMSDSVTEAKTNYLPKDKRVKELFVLADKISKSENISSEIDGLIAHLRTELLTSNSLEDLERIKAVFIAKKNLKVTTNKKLVIENMMIELTS